MPALTPANDVIRARNVTASEVGALLGPHPYTDPLRIYHRLMRAPEYIAPTHTQAMELGVYFERRIAQFAAKQIGVRIRANNRSIEHPKGIMLSATPDYYVLHPRGVVAFGPPRMLIECKLSSILYGWTEDKLASHIEWQARAQLAVTRRDVCMVAALVGSQFHLIPVVRDMNKERMMIDAVNEMEGRIMRGLPPAPPEIPHLRKVVVMPSTEGRIA